MLISAKSFLSDYRVQVALGRVPGVSGLRKFGHNTAVGATPVDIWDGNIIYPWPVAGNPLRIAAGGDAEDDASGDGSREVEITGLDSTTWKVVTATLATNGVLASADTAISFSRVFRVKSTYSGLYGARNTAAITIETNPGGVTLAVIPAGHGQSQMAMATIPDGKVGLLCQYDVTVDTTGSAAFDVRLWKREDADVVAAPFTSPRIIGELHGIADRANREFCIMPEVLPARTDIWMDASSSSGTNKITAEFDLFLVDV